MGRNQNILSRLALFASIPLFCIAIFCLLGWVFTTGQLRLARSKGVYPSAEDAMRALIVRSYNQPEEVEIVYAGTNSFDGSNPHVWYVIACIWGGTRADGSPVGSERHIYDQPGTFFLDTRDGWVTVQADGVATPETLLVHQQRLNLTQRFP